MLARNRNVKNFIYDEAGTEITNADVKNDN